jgi:hypothetical protein
MPRTVTLLPLAVRRALRQLGRDIHYARRRRRLTATMVAERAHITRPTLRRVERGDPSVALGTYATVLWVLGLGERVGELATPAADIVGLSLADEDLPKRVYTIRKSSKAPHERTEHPTKGDARLTLETGKAKTRRNSVGRTARGQGKSIE